jgi:transcriptional regulator with XRE-family HTH domain
VSTVKVAGNALRFQLARRALDQQRLAEIAQVSPTTISIAARSGRVRPSTLEKITRALLAVPVVEGIDGLGLIEGGPPT